MKARSVSDREQVLFEEFADGKLSLTTLTDQLGGVISLEFQPTERRLTSYFLVLEPGIQLIAERIDAARQRLTSSNAGKRAIVEWSTMLLLNSDVYEWDGDSSNGEYVSFMLHDLSMGHNS